ncbi:hypothetical protein [Streptomyces sp. NBC_00670]|nr:hypothetical protein [Streptomyces sp. NBC_00670]
MNSPVSIGMASPMAAFASGSRREASWWSLVLHTSVTRIVTSSSWESPTT